MRLVDLVLRFVVDMTNWSSGIKQAQKDIDGTEKSTKKLGAAAGLSSRDLLLLSGSVTAAGYAAYAEIQHFGALANEIEDLSYTTGVSTDKIQKLRLAAILAGDDFGPTSAGLNRLTLAMDEAKDKTSEAAKAFARLGIDPTGKTPDEVFDEITSALIHMKNETARNALANTLLGRSWKEMLPTLETYYEKKKKIDDTNRYTEKEIQNMKDLKTATDEQVHSMDTFFGKRISNLVTLWNYQDKLGKNVISGKTQAAKGSDKPVAEDTGEQFGPFQGIDPFAGLTAKQADLKLLTDYTIPDLTKKLRELQKTGGSASDIAAASLDLKKAQEQLIEVSAKETDAQGDLKSAYEDLTTSIDDVAEARERLADIDKNYQRDLSTADIRNPADIRNIIRQHQWNTEDQQERIGTAQSGVLAAGAAYGNAVLGKASGTTIAVTGPITVIANNPEELGRQLAQQNRSGGVPQR
jgi:hypothetical protein